MTSSAPAPDGSPDAPVDSPSGSALDSDSALVPAGPAAGRLRWSGVIAVQRSPAGTTADPVRLCES